VADANAAEVADVLPTADAEAATAVRLEVPAESLPAFAWATLEVDTLLVAVANVGTDEEAGLHRHRCAVQLLELFTASAC
jgi:hypothetical protein